MVQCYDEIYAFDILCNGLVVLDPSQEGHVIFKYIFSKCVVPVLKGLS